MSRRRYKAEANLGKLRQQVEVLIGGSGRPRRAGRSRSCGQLAAFSRPSLDKTLVLRRLGDRGAALDRVSFCHSVQRHRDGTLRRFDQIAIGPREGA